MAQQSLYRRYRPRRFAEMRGQEHVVRALRNAVEGDTAGQAYLFSGPRGTGKTTTARILAKVLNCTNVSDGEPCCECESCVAMEAGSSYDLFELDAASNNGVDSMRDLVSRAAVGSPGRNKVYILDEVHMLSTAASNALLKTLEEPPDHVTFVLATTDPQKVLPTIRSRTQHYEFSLLTAEQLDEYVRWIVGDAGLTVDDAAIAHVVRVGRGSARDTLSALDQVVAAGGVVVRPAALDELVAAIGERDSARAMVAMAEAIDQGRDPRMVGEALLGALRDAFLVTVGAPAAHLSEPDREQASALGDAVGAAGLTRALEMLGTALVDMRQAADPRIPIEVALVRICDPTTDASVAALVERVADLERAVARGVVAPGATADTAASPRSLEPPAGSPARGSRGQHAAAAPAPAPASPPAPDIPPPPPRARRPEPAPAPERTPEPVAATPPEPQRAPEPEPPAPVPTPAPAAVSTGGDLPTVDELTAAMADGVLARLKGVAKAIYTAGRFVEVRDGSAVFALANAPTRDRAERVRADVEAALAQQFGRPVPLTLVDETGAGPASGARGRTAPRPAAAAAPASPVAPPPAPEPTGPEHDDAVDVTQLRDANDVASTGVERLTKAFPGAEVLEEEST